MNKEQLKKLHSCMLEDNEHQTNGINNYLNPKEYLPSNVVKYVDELIGEYWHDLRKNPNDLPKDEGFLETTTLILLVGLVGSNDIHKCFLGTYNFDDFEFKFPHLVDVEEVKCWKKIEIPQLPKEE